MGRHPIDWHPTIAFGNQKRRDRKNNGDDQQCRGAGYRNHDVLAIDMDPQADMTKGLGLGPGDDNDPSSPKNELPNTLVTDDENLLDVLVDNPRTHDTSLFRVMIEADEYDHLNFDLIPQPQGYGPCSRLDGRCECPTLAEARPRRDG